MKNKFLYIVVFFVAFTSCKKFLDSEPITNLTDANYYKNKADAEKAIIGCYDGMQQIWNAGISFPIMSEICSDNCFGGTGNADGWNYQAVEEFDIARSPADRDLFNENWKAYYKAVYRCNVLLSKMDQIDWQGDDEYKMYIESQARFIRAYLYFDMVRLWGNIPLLTQPSSENLPQANPSEVYKTIAEDLKFASENIQSDAYSASWSAENDGRVTKWAAKALLARVFLFYTGYYEKTDLEGVVSKEDVLNGLEDIINNGGYTLLPTFASLFPASAGYQKQMEGSGSTFSYAGNGNSETIFSIKYNYTGNYDGKVDGNTWLVMLGLRNVTSYPYSKGWGAGTVEPRLWNSYSNQDTRRNLSIINIVGENIAAEINDQREYTGYINKKYTPISVMVNGVPVDYAQSLGAADFMIGQFQDYVVLRYADVLLMAAELGSGNAQSYLDQVRQRAFGSNYTQVTANKENILNERKLEFAFEGIRYWDVLRQGINYAASTLATSVTVLNGGSATIKTVKAENIIKTKGLMQIPEDQILKSKGVLIQNAGWE